MAFDHSASFPVALISNGVAENISVTRDGMALICSDSPLGAIGKIDLTDTAATAPLGQVEMAVSPLPVSVPGRTAFVAVQTSEIHTDPAASPWTGSKGMRASS